MLLRTHEDLPALNCIQYNAEKKIVTEEDIIQSNKQGFGSKIGAITNRITEMTSLMSEYDKDSEEYKILKYRTQCGQNFQQNEIDKAKGIISNEMPKSWYVYLENKIDPEKDTIQEARRKKLYQKICAHKKPYFFQFNYQYLHKDYSDYISNVEAKSLSQYKMAYVELLEKDNPTEEETKFLQRIKNKMPLDSSTGTQNRICWAVEKELDNIEFPNRESFDYSMLKSDVAYLNATFYEIKRLYQQYVAMISNIKKKQEFDLDELQSVDRNDEQYGDSIEQIELLFEQKCAETCPNEEELCNILLDLCYNNRNSKDIVWKVCGQTLLNNLAKNNNNNMYYPSKVEQNHEFECCGAKFIMKKVKIGGENNV